MNREGPFYAEQLQIEQYQHDRLILARKTCERCMALAAGAIALTLIAWGAP